MKILTLQSHMCRPAYDSLKKLPTQFPGVTLMALIATATSHTVSQLKQLLGSPMSEISSVNKTNIHPTYVLEIKSQGISLNVHTPLHVSLIMVLCIKYYAVDTEKYTNLANNILPVVGESKCIIYVDFVCDIAPLAISLHQNDIHSCAYQW